MKYTFAACLALDCILAAHPTAASSLGCTETKSVTLKLMGTGKVESSATLRGEFQLRNLGKSNVTLAVSTQGGRHVLSYPQAYLQYETSSKEWETLLYPNGVFLDPPNELILSPGHSAPVFFDAEPAKNQTLVSPSGRYGIVIRLKKPNKCVISEPYTLQN